MTKILQITNNKETYDIECVEQIHTLVSGEILRKFKDHEDVNAEDVVLDVLLMISGIETDDRKNWKFLSDVLVSEQTT
jgi:hypothetical protein